MQNKLARWSTENRERKFDRLLRLVADRTWLIEAARITLASRGAKTPSVDGVDKQRMEDNLQNELATIHAELLARSYRTTGYTYGHGTDLGKRFPFRIQWIQAGAQRASCDSHGETSIA